MTLETYNLSSLKNSKVCDKKETLHVLHIKVWKAVIQHHFVFILYEERHFGMTGLVLSADGESLIDRKTGQTINEFGATRFDVAVRGNVSASSKCFVAHIKISCR